MTAKNSRVDARSPPATLIQLARTSSPPHPVRDLRVTPKRAAISHLFPRNVAARPHPPENREIAGVLERGAIAFGYRHLCCEPQINHFVMAITATKAMVWHVPSRELICTGELRCTPQLPSPPPL
jgi:hypothetical protein